MAATCPRCSIDCSISTSLLCESCKSRIHIKCLEKEPSTPLVGDTFFTLLCRNCSRVSDVVKRAKVNWMTALVLALYNLKLRSNVGRKGYFHWKIHIATFLESNWACIFTPQMKKRKTWLGTISGTLSHWTGEIFESGYKELGEAGWWKLSNVAEHPAEFVSIKPTITKVVESVVSPSVVSNSFEHKRTRGVQSSIATAMALKERRLSETKEVCNTKKRKRTDSNVKREDGNQERSVLRPVSKRKKKRRKDWFEKVRPEVTSAELPLDLFNNDDDDDDDDEDNDDEDEEDEEKDNDEDDDDDDDEEGNDSDDTDLDLPDISYSFEDSSDWIMNKSSLPDVQDLLSNVKSTTDEPRSIKIEEPEEPEEPEEEEEPEKESNQKPRLIPSPEPDPTIIPMSVNEEERLLKRLESQPTLLRNDLFARQLRRKLIVRRTQRLRRLPVFDFDSLYRQILRKPSTATTTTTTTTLEESRFLSKGSRILDRYVGGSSLHDQCSDTRLTLKMKLIGRNEITPSSVVSPFTGRTLKPFIRRDYECTPLKLKLLREIAGVHYGKYPIDYSYVRPHHIPAVNHLAERFFWPGIDLSECLQYPDFSCVVSYRRIVVAFAFMVPDVNHTEAYISFIFTHPEWRRAGIATFMLYHLIQTCMGKDITLHVSSNNPAVMLYQKFGFKIEEHVMDFYDKYLPPDSSECKHALFMRLAR